MTTSIHITPLKVKPLC